MIDPCRFDLEVSLSLKVNLGEKYRESEMLMSKLRVEDPRGIAEQYRVGGEKEKRERERKVQRKGSRSIEE